MNMNALDFITPQQMEDSASWIYNTAPSQMHKTSILSYQSRPRGEKSLQGRMMLQTIKSRKDMEEEVLRAESRINFINQGIESSIKADSLRIKKTDQLAKVRVAHQAMKNKVVQQRELAEEQMRMKREKILGERLARQQKVRRAKDVVQRNKKELSSRVKSENSELEDKLKTNQQIAVSHRQNHVRKHSESQKISYHRRAASEDLKRMMLQNQYNKNMQEEELRREQAKKKLAQLKEIERKQIERLKKTSDEKYMFVAKNMMAKNSNPLFGQKSYKQLYICLY